MMLGEVEIARVEHRGLAGEALEHGGFEIVDHDFHRHPMTKELKGVLMAGEGEERGAAIAPGDDSRILEADLFGEGTWSRRDKRLRFTS
jgi:hypothetical protein